MYEAWSNTIMKKYTDIPTYVRDEVYRRDGIEGHPCCIYCGSPRHLELAHYVPRSRGGRGVPENLAVLCTKCHKELDNGSNTTLSRDIKEVFRDWLCYNYPGWNEEGVVYKKYE